MSDPFLSEIKIMSFNFAPRGWALCNGQLLPINQNQALFSLLGTTYGGNGQTNFALPDLRSRTPISFGNGFTLGQRAGQENHTLISSEALHVHAAVGSSNSPDLSDPTNVFWASNTTYKPYAATPNSAMSPITVSAVGGSQPHNNLQPYLVLNFCIALQGIFPSQN